MYCAGRVARSQIIEKNEEHDKKMQLELRSRGLYDTVLWQPTNFSQGNIDAIQRWVAKTFDKHMPEDADLVKVRTAKARRHTIGRQVAL